MNKNGAGERHRTPNIRFTGTALCQLSYTGICMVENPRFELGWYPNCKSGVHPKQTHSPKSSERQHLVLASAELRSPRQVQSLLRQSALAVAFPSWRRDTESNRKTIARPQFSGLFDSLNCRSRQKLKSPNFQRLGPRRPLTLDTHQPQPEAVAVVDDNDVNLNIKFGSGGGI